MGAMYPGIDLGAGEKERGTLETLLSTPTKRIHIILGKFFVVMIAITKQFSSQERGIIDCIISFNW